MLDMVECDTWCMSQNRSAGQRVHRSPEERSALVAAWVKSGKSAQAFEREHGLSKSSLWRWQQACGRRAKKSGPAARASILFAPVHVTQSQPEAVVSERVVAEVIIGPDVKVRVLHGADANQVALLVRALAGGFQC